MNQTLENYHLSGHIREQQHRIIENNKEQQEMNQGKNRETLERKHAICYNNEYL
jgi:hypothetical protein